MPDAPLVRFLNREVRKYVRWCTPSVLPDAPRVEDVYGTDVSASLFTVGTLAQNSGIFAEAHERAARLFKADRTLFSVHGTTGSVYVVMRYLSIMYGTPLVLATRNIHVSFHNACEDFGIRYRFIRSHYDPEFDAFVPPTPDDVREALERYPEANAVFVTSPTYEGLSARLREIVSVVRSFDPDILVIVDEAWGAHFLFSEELPETAMEAGADISMQSTHKQGGSLQQTGMIHWREGRVDSDVMWEAYRGYVTSSPSYHLLASLDAARACLEERGREHVSRVIRLAGELRDSLRSEVPGLMILDDDSVERWREHVSGWDRSKVLASLSEFAVTGFEVERELQVRHRVVADTASFNSVLFIATFQLGEEAVEPTVRAVSEVLEGRRISGRKELLSPPLRDEPPRVEPYLVRRMPRRVVSHRVPLELAPGLVAAENITPYPPGIPIVIRGFRIREEDVEYLRAVRERGGILMARDPTLSEVEVLPVA